ncbi:Gag-Pol polyprotein [Plecturocebus cupreus]
MHCHGHQWAHTSVALGNSQADSAARKAVSTPYQDGRVVVPQLLGAAVVQAVHETTHLGQESLERLLGQYFYISHLSALTTTVMQRRITRRQHNMRQDPTIPPSIQAYGAAPFEDLQVDFTEMPKWGGHKYLLVLVCIYSGTEKAHEITCVLLRDFIPRFGLPLCIGSDNGPAFVAHLVWETAVTLGITWKLHAAY